MSSLRVHNRQRKIRIDLETMQAFAERAVAQASRLRPRTLPPVDVVLISDKRMSVLHERFMGIAGPTDVITFQHGEIFVSAEAARRQARSHGTTALQEIQLYIVHGLLHLLGFDDTTPAKARVMRKTQAQILRVARNN